MPFCTKCGTQMPDDYRFCMKCGAPVVILEPAKPAQPTAAPAEPVAQPVAAPVVETPVEAPAEPQIPVENNEVAETVETVGYSEVAAPVEPVETASPVETAAVETAAVPDGELTEEDKAAMKAQALAELDSMIRVFKPYEQKIEELNRIEAEEKSKSISRDPAEKVRVNLPDGSTLKTIGWILIGGAIFPGGIFAILSWRGLADAIESSDFRGDAVLALIICLVWTAMLATGIVFQIISKKQRENYAVQLQMARDNARKNSKNRKQELMTELNEVCKKYGKYGLRTKDCDPKVLRKIRAVIVMDQAYNIKDAVSIYHKGGHIAHTGKKTTNTRAGNAPQGAVPRAPMAGGANIQEPAYGGLAPVNYAPPPQTTSSSGSGKKGISLRANWQNAEIYTLRFVEPKAVIEMARSFPVLQRASLSADAEGTMYFKANYWTARLQRQQAQGGYCVYRFEFLGTETRNGIPLDPGGMNSLYDSVGRMLVSIDPETTVKKEAKSFTSKSHLF